MKTKQPAFERQKIRRLIVMQGKEYLFYRPVLNDFNEPTGEALEIPVTGAFHRVVNHISVMTTQGASVQSKPTPYILCLYEDGKSIKEGDFVMLDGMEHRVTGVTDVNLWGFAIDISLELVVDGNQQS